MHLADRAAGDPDHRAGRDLELGVGLAEPDDPAVDPARGQDLVALLDLALQRAHHRDPPLLGPPEQQVEGPHHEDQPDDTERQQRSLRVAGGPIDKARRVAKAGIDATTA